MFLEFQLNAYPRAEILTPNSTIAFLERNYEEDDEEDGGEDVKKEEDKEDAPIIESKLPRQTQRLIELIFNQNHFNAVLESIGYNANKLPLGKLSKATLKQGFDHLNELASLIKHPSLARDKYGVDQFEVRLAFPGFYGRPSTLLLVSRCLNRMIVSRLLTLGSVNFAGC